MKTDVDKPITFADRREDCKIVVTKIYSPMLWLGKILTFSYFTEAFFMLHDWPLLLKCNLFI